MVMRNETDAEQGENEVAELCHLENNTGEQIATTMPQIMTPVVMEAILQH